MDISKCCNHLTFRDQYNHLRCEKCLSITKHKRSLRLPLILFFMMVFMGYSVLSNREGQSPLKFVKTEQKADTCDIPLNKDSILKQLIEDSCYFPQVAINQFIIESHYGDSKICSENLNLFGLKCSCKLCKGFKYGHSVYSSRRDGILCYTRFMNSFWRKYCSVYAEDKDYLSKLGKIN